MNLDRERVSAIVRSLLSGLNEDDLHDGEERRLFRSEGALPVGWGLWSMVFLSPEGDVLSIDPGSNEIERSHDLQNLAHVLVSASERYPEFRELIPDRPADAPNCVICGGTGLHHLSLPGMSPPSCALCGGLGWVWSQYRPPN